MKALTNHTLVNLDAAAALIARGSFLSVAGPEHLLDQLPKGRWIGGTSSYFMTDDGGVKSGDKVFVSPLPDEGAVSFKVYDPSTLSQITRDAPDNGFTCVVVPTGTATLQYFAENSRFWPDIYMKPVVGWVAGIDLAQIGRQSAYVYNGADGSKHADAMVAAHATLPEGRIATLQAINIFRADPRFVLRFPKTLSETVECTVNGQSAKLADFLKENGNADGKLPLVGDFGGASINVSIQSVDANTGLVKLYAPVFADVEYRLASQVDDYEARFAEEIAAHGGETIAFSCNCILNYLYGNLEGKKTGHIVGPVTFGEIAYLLLNQTLAILEIR